LSSILVSPANLSFQEVLSRYKIVIKWGIIMIIGTSEIMVTLVTMLYLIITILFLKIVYKCMLMK